MINSTRNHGVQLAASARLRPAPPEPCACGPLALPSPPPRRPWMRHEAQSAGERGECAQRPAHLPTSGPTTISLTALLTHLLSHAPSIPTSNPTPNSTSNRTIFARSSRARRNRRRAGDLQQKLRFVLIKKVGVCAWGSSVGFGWRALGARRRQCFARHPGPGLSGIAHVGRLR